MILTQRTCDFSRLNQPKPFDRPWRQSWRPTSTRPTEAPATPERSAPAASARRRGDDDDVSVHGGGKLDHHRKKRQRGPGCGKVVLFFGALKL